MAHTRQWNESSPTDQDWAHQIDDFLRNLKVDVRERMELEHYWNNETDINQPDADGRHKPGIVRVCFVGTQAQIDALTGVGEGCLAYDTDAEVLKVYHGGAWMGLDVTTWPAFSAYIDSSWNVPKYTNDDTVGKMVNYTEDFDDGGNFDDTNGEFIAPYDGIYIFTGRAGIHRPEPDDALHLYIIRERSGSYLRLAHSSSIDSPNSSDDTHAAVVTSVCKLQQNDKVFLRAVHEHDGTVPSVSYRSYNGFDGALIRKL